MRRHSSRSTRKKCVPPVSDCSSSDSSARSVSPSRSLCFEPPGRPTLGYSPFGFCDTTSVCPPSEVAAIHTLGVGSNLGSIPYVHQNWMNPLHGLNVLSMARKPSPFTGQEPGDWPRFVREWKPFERILEQTYPPTLWDTVKLENLKSLLDKTSLADFQAKYEANSELTFAEFWEEIDKEFGRDTTAQNRAAWKKVKLNMAGKILTLADWRTFQREFVLHRGRVEDRTENEEWELLIAQLPTYWTTEVAKEESKKDLLGHWVKITDTPDLSKKDMEHILKNLLRARIQELQKVDNGFRVSLKSESEQTKLLKMHGAKINGKVIKITRHQPRMTPDEIFAFVATRLRTKETAMDVKRTICSLNDPPAESGHIRAVTIEFPEQPCDDLSDHSEESFDQQKEFLSPSGKGPHHNFPRNSHFPWNSGYQAYDRRGKYSDWPYDSQQNPHWGNWQKNWNYQGSPRNRNVHMVQQQNWPSWNSSESSSSSSQSPPRRVIRLGEPTPPDVYYPFITRAQRECQNSVNNQDDGNYFPPQTTSASSRMRVQQ